MRAARLVAGLRHRHFRDPQRHARADLAADRLERGAAGEPEAFRLRLLDEPRHHLTCRRCLTSAVPPCTASSWAKMAVASPAIASAISMSIRRPFSVVAGCVLANQAVRATELSAVG